MRKLLVIIALLASCFAQQPQTTNPLSGTNAKYSQGVSYGYMPIPSTASLSLPLGAGTCFTATPSRVAYAGATLTLTASQTNYVYLDSSCAVQQNTTGYPAASIVPIGSFTTNGAGVTSYNDDRDFARISSAGGSGTVSNCATNGSIAYYASSGTTVSCVGTDLTFATNTLTAGASLIVDLSAITSTAGFKVPVKAGNTATAAGVIDFDSTGNNYHAFSGGADHVVVTAASIPANSDCPVWVVSGSNVLLGSSGSPCAAGTFTTVNGTANQIDSSAPSGPSTTLSLSSTLTFPGTITMGANTANFGSATSFKIPSSAGCTSSADGFICYDTTAKSTHVRTNGADSIAATFASAPAGTKCLQTSGTTGLITETSGACGTGSGTVTGVTATAPVVCTPSSPNPNCSLTNSAAANVTSAYGTDTAYPTASSGPYSVGQVIVGDAQGGVKPVTGGTAGLCLVSNGASSDPSWQSCSTPSTITVGGIMGGTAIGNTLNSSSVLPPWVSGASGTRNIMPFGAYFRNASVITTAASTIGLLGFGFNGSSNGVTDTASDLGRITIANGAAAGTFSEHTGSRPYYVGQGMFTFIQVYTYSTSFSSPTMSGFSWDIIGSTSQPLGWINPGNAVIGASTTVFVSPSHGASPQATEAKAAVVIPYASTAKNLCVFMNTAQSSNNSVVITLRLTHAGSTSSTALVTTIPLSGAAGTYCDSTDTVSIAAGDWITWQIQNNANANSGQFGSIAMELVPSGNATGMIVFGRDGISYNTTNANQYAAPFTTSANQTTYNIAAAPMPRAVTAKNLYCIYTAVPANQATATLFKNTASTSLVATIPTTGSGTQIVSDLVNSVSFAQFDTFNLAFLQNGGGSATISSCSMEVD